MTVNKCVVFIVFSILCVLSACRSTVELPHNCIGSDLLLDASVFPIGATQGAFISPYPEGTSNSAGTSFSTADWVFTHAVLPFSSIKRAQSEFDEDLRDPIYSEQESENMWTKPEALADAFSEANESRISCGQEGSIQKCQGIARYDVYFIRFIAVMNPPAFSEMDLNHVLLELETNLLACTSQLDE